MFRLFLRKKILSGKDKDAKGGKGRAGEEPPRRNRRVFARYAIDHKHLTLMNEQDILLVREISAKGFSTEVSPRGISRMLVGDVYEARARYMRELYDLQARVAWKAESYVGFEIVKAGRETMGFIRRLLRPVEIANSLKQVEASFMSEAAGGKCWYHGDEESDLYLWYDPDTTELRAWQLAIGSDYVEWSATTGLTTGALAKAPGREAFMGAQIEGLTHQQDDKPDAHKKQFAVDVIMALQQQPVREEILETLSA